MVMRGLVIEVFHGNDPRAKTFTKSHFVENNTFRKQHSLCHRTTYGVRQSCYNNSFLDNNKIWCHKTTCGKAIVEEHHCIDPKHLTLQLKIFTMKLLALILPRTGKFCDNYTQHIFLDFFHDDITLHRN